MPYIQLSGNKLRNELLDFFDIKNPGNNLIFPGC